MNPIKETIAIKGFPSFEDARDVVPRLEAEGIPCRIATDEGGVFATLFVAPEHVDVASQIISDVGFDIAPPSDVLTNESSDSISSSNVSSEDSPNIQFGVGPELLGQVTAELETAAKKEKSPWQNLGALALSLFLFISLGLFQGSIAGVALLVIVLFVHECGHFIGMKLLRYKDVQMFFIPMLGAAVSGTESNPSSPRKAIVSLLGPAPGIVIGIITGIAFLKTGEPLLAKATRTFLFLNAFNLLPFHPLDGGHFFDAILFSRHPKLEVGFKVVTTLILGGLALWFHDVVLGFFAFGVFIFLKATHIMASTAYNFKKRLGNDTEAMSDTIPTKHLPLLISLFLEELPVARNNPKLIASYAKSIWLRVRNKPCPIIPAIGLVLCYFFFLILGFGSGIVFEVALHAVAKQRAGLTEQSKTVPNP